LVVVSFIHTLLGWLVGWFQVVGFHPWVDSRLSWVGWFSLGFLGGLVWQWMDGWVGGLLLCLYSYCYSPDGAHPGEGRMGGRLVVDSNTLHYLHFTHTHSLLQLQRWRFFWDVLALLDSFRHLPMGTWLPWMSLFAFAAYGTHEDGWGSGSGHCCTWFV
jgi:hypothetical protein